MSDSAEFQARLALATRTAQQVAELIQGQDFSMLTTALTTVLGVAVAQLPESDRPRAISSIERYVKRATDDAVQRRLTGARPGMVH